jgi:hypothetical protein
LEASLRVQETTVVTTRTTTLELVGSHTGVGFLGHQLSNNPQIEIMDDQRSPPVKKSLPELPQPPSSQLLIEGNDPTSSALNEIEGLEETQLALSQDDAIALAVQQEMQGKRLKNRCRTHVISSYNRLAPIEKWVLPN